MEGEMEVLFFSNAPHSCSQLELSKPRINTICLKVVFSSVVVAYCRLRPLSSVHCPLRPEWKNGHQCLSIGQSCPILLHTFMY